MKKWILSTAFLVAFSGGDAQAQSFGANCPSPYSNQKGSYHSYGRTLPVYMAAPWYLYWPYDAHFMTPAPVQGAWHGPPMMGNYPVQPYFPMPQYAPPMQQMTPPIQPMIPNPNPMITQPPVNYPPVGQ